MQTTTYLPALRRPFVTAGLGRNHLVLAATLAAITMVMVAAWQRCVRSAHACIGWEAIRAVRRARTPPAPHDPERIKQSSDQTINQ